MAADLHGLAVEAHSALEKLATGLGQAGADDNTVKAVSQMADVTSKIVKALGKGQEQSGDSQPAPPPDAGPQQPSSFDDAANQMMAARHAGPPAA